MCAAFLVFTHFSCTLCALSICVYINFEMDFSCLESRQQREKMALSAAKKWRAETSAHWRQRVQGQRERQQPRADSVAKGNCINNPEKQKRPREREGRERERGGTANRKSRREFVLVAMPKFTTSTKISTHKFRKLKNSRNNKAPYILYTYTFLIQAPSPCSFNWKT